MGQLSSSAKVLEWLFREGWQLGVSKKTTYGSPAAERLAAAQKNLEDKKRKAAEVAADADEERQLELQLEAARAKAMHAPNESPSGSTGPVNRID